MKKTIILSFYILFLVLEPAFLAQPAHNWNSPSEVVKQVKKKFNDLSSYKANFQIQTVSNKKSKNMRGVCLYKKGGRIRYQFSDPSGDEIVSDGKTLYIYIARLNAVGKQDLTLNKSNKSGPIFSSLRTKAFPEFLESTTISSIRSNNHKLLPRMDVNISCSIWNNGKK